MLRYCVYVTAAVTVPDCCYYCYCYCYRNECAYNVTDEERDGETLEMQCTEWDFDNSVFGTTLTEEVIIPRTVPYMGTLSLLPIVVIVEV